MLYKRELRDLVCFLGQVSPPMKRVQQLEPRKYEVLLLVTRQQTV